MSRWKITRCGPSEHQRLLAFLEQAYPPGVLQQDRVRYEALFGTGADQAVACNIYIAENGEQIVASVAAMPFELIVERKPLKCAWVFNAVVAEAYRRQGIMSELTKSVAAEFDGAGVLHTNRTSAGVLRSLGWVELGHVSRYAYLTSVSKYVSRRLPSGLRPVGWLWQWARHIRQRVAQRNWESVNGVDVREIEQFESQYDIGNVQYRIPCMPKRTAARLNWRFIDRPRAKYKVIGAFKDGCSLGWMVIAGCVVRGVRRGHIIDFLFDPACPSVGTYLLTYALQVFERAEVEVVDCSASYAPYVRLLQQLGFVKREADFDVFVTPNLGKHRLCDWHLTRGNANMDDELFHGFRAADGDLAIIDLANISATPVRSE